MSTQGEEVSMATRKSPAVETEISSNAAVPGFSSEVQGDTSASLASLERIRIERKRNREKKRRSDVNKGLDALMELVFVIDPRVKLEAEERAAKVTSGGRTGSSDAPTILSRVELINTVYATLERVHEENGELKRVIAQLASNPGRGAGDAGTGAAPQPAAAACLPPNVMTGFSNAREIQVSFQLLSHCMIDAVLHGSNFDFCDS
jgi:hypothetical protein